MPQTPGDATRFTATAPVASTMNPSPSRIDFGSAPAGETPQQKIARLRRAAAIARQGKEETFDKVVRIGRTWADRAHRITTLSLVGLTVVSVLVAVAGTTEIVLHNRARRRDWYKEQTLKRQLDIAVAQKALSDGTITPDQLLLLGQERAKAEAAEALNNRPGAIKRTTNYLFGGLAKEEQKGGRLGSKHTPKEFINEIAKEAKTSTRDIASDSRAAIPRASLAGGPLDHQAQQAYDATIRQTQNWQKWLLRQ